MAAPPPPRAVDEAARRQEAKDALRLMDYKIYGPGASAPAGAGPMSPTPPAPATTTTELVFVPGAGFQPAVAAAATTLSSPPPALATTTTTPDHHRTNHRLPFPLILLLILAPWLIPAFALARLLYTRHLRRRAATARLLSRPPTAQQVQALLGARPLWLPPRALAPTANAEDERLQWLNILLEQLWPALDAAAASLIADAVQPLIDAARPAFVARLGFERLSLGALPLRVERLRLLDPASPPVATPARGLAEGAGAGVAVEADVAWQGHANVSFFVDLAAPAGGPSVRLVPRVDDIGLRGTLRLALAPAHAAPSSPSSSSPPPPPLPSAVVASFSSPPTVKFALRFARSLGPVPGMVGGLVEAPVQRFLDGVLREALCQVMVWPQRVVVPVAPLLRPLVARVFSSGQGVGGGGAGGGGEAEREGERLLRALPEDERPPDGLLDDEDAALDALHLRSVGLLRVEALGVRRAGEGDAGSDERLPGSGLGQRLELEAWTEPSSRARLPVVAATAAGPSGAATMAAAAPSSSAASATTMATAAAAASQAALPGSVTATSAPAAGGGETNGFVELLVQEPQSQRLRLSLRVADALAAPKALLRGDWKGALMGSGGGGGAGGSGDSWRDDRVGRASIALSDLAPEGAEEVAAAAATADGGASSLAPASRSRVVDDWFALSPADEDWEDIEQSAWLACEALGQQRKGEGDGDDEREEEQERRQWWWRAGDEDDDASGQTAAGAAAAAAAMAGASSPAAASRPLQLRLRLTFLPLAAPEMPTPSSGRRLPVVPARGGVLRLAVRRARRLPADREAGAHYATVDVGPPAAAGAAGASAAPSEPSSRHRQTPPMPPCRAPAWRARFEFSSVSLSDSVRVAVWVKQWWAADVKVGEAVLSVRALLGMASAAEEGEEGGGGDVPWPAGEWSERRVGAAEGWADLIDPSAAWQGGIIEGRGTPQVLLRAEYVSAGTALEAAAAAKG